MQLSDVTNLVDIVIPDDPEAQKKYKARLAAAIDQAKVYCNRSFEVDGILTIPEGAQMGIALMVKGMGENNQNVQSQRLGDMSKSFFQNGTFSAAKSYLKPYRKVGFK